MYFLMYVLIVIRIVTRIISIFFFSKDTATPEIYTLSLHDALPICRGDRRPGRTRRAGGHGPGHRRPDRKSTRLNSSHVEISYAVFCLKKKKYRHNQMSKGRLCIAVDADFDGRSETVRLRVSWLDGQ